MVDIRDGLVPLDEQIARMLRKHNLDVIGVANKADEAKMFPAAGEFARLGFGTEVKKRQAIEMTSVWLTEHPDNVDVRKRFLKTIERFGSTDQIQKMLPLVKEWRAKDPSLQ